jgi:predicted PurR-regulated permease PerM
LEFERHGNFPGGKDAMTSGGRDVVETQIQTACLIILAGVALGISLHLLRPVLVPFVLAVFFTYCLSAVVDLLVHRVRLPRLPAIVSTGILGILALGLAGALVVTAIARIKDNYTDYQIQLAGLAKEVAQVVPLARLGVRLEPGGGGLA